MFTPRLEPQREVSLPSAVDRRLVTAVLVRELASVERVGLAALLRSEVGASLNAVASANEETEARRLVDRFRHVPRDSGDPASHGSVLTTHCRDCAAGVPDPVPAVAAGWPRDVLRLGDPKPERARCSYTASMANE